MSIFQKLYDAIKGFKTPRWIVAILQEIQDALVQILVQVGKDYLEQIQGKILEVSSTSMTNREKFNAVFKYGKELLPSIKDSALNLLIESLFNRLKSNRAL